MCVDSADIAEVFESLPALIVSYQGLDAGTSVGSCHHAIRPRCREASARFSAHADSSTYIHSDHYCLCRVVCVCGFVCLCARVYLFF